MQACPVCGSGSPGVLRSTGDLMVVQFLTDSSSTRSGFSADFSSVYRPMEEENITCPSGRFAATLCGYLL